MKVVMMSEFRAVAVGEAFDAHVLAWRHDQMVRRQSSRARVIDAKQKADAVAGTDKAYRTRRMSARSLIAEGAATCGDEAIGRVVMPLIERVMRGDVEIVDVAATHEVGVIRAMRSKGLGYLLKRLGVGPDLTRSGLRFAREIEAARIGRLTASYEGASGSGAHVAEPERWRDAMWALKAASNGPWSDPITHDERVALYAVLAFDVPLSDLGRYVSAGLTMDKNMLVFTGKLSLIKGLNKLTKFYSALDMAKMMRQNEAKSA